MTSDTQPVLRAEPGRRRSRPGPRSADSRSTDSSRPPTPTVKRLDLQGLRALAVGLVVLNHAFEWPAGGFVGVDIFFVISGFLMTSLLYREYERHGRIRFVAFYRRRIRRLIPASVAVLVATIAVAWALFGSGRFVTTVWDAVASLFFVSNWRFAAAQTDYFAQGAQTSPLQHYWSLSLEEQYYLVWPAAILLIALLARRAGRPRVFAALTTLGITVGLFFLSLQLTKADSGTAYFITPARLWELSVGATVALFMPWFSRLPSMLRPVIALLALAGMITAAAITPSDHGFPAPWAALAVVSAAVFIAFPWQPQRPWLNPLDNPFLGYIGDISYSLYLWHFPALIFVTELARGTPSYGTPIPALESIALSVVLAALSYRFIEEPVRQSSWLEPSAERKKRRAVAKSRRAQLIALSATTVVVAAVVAMTFVVERNARFAPADPTAEGSTSPSAGGVADTPSGDAAVQSLAAALAEALKATSWPELAPDMDTVTSTYVGNDEANACAGWNYPGVKACTWGPSDAAAKVAIVGDSTSSKYVPMLRALAEARGGAFSVTGFATNNCPFVDIETETADRQNVHACTARKELALTDIAALKPDVLIITNSYIPPHQASDQAPVSFAENAQGVQRYIDKLRPEVGQFVLVAPPPADKDVRECYSPRTGPKDCVSRVTSDWKGMAAADEKLAGEGVVWIDSRPLFCEKSNCPAFADGIPVKFDKTHITEEYARHIAPAFATLLNEKDIGFTRRPHAEARP